VPPDDETEADRRHAQTLATALARAVDAKDPYTRSHCETVSALCGLIGEELGLAPERLRSLRLAGLLHDVGKIGVGDEILLKPGKLTDEEFEVMKSHSTIGHRIVMGAALEEQAHAVLHHHERPDGRGYPDGLSGNQVPLESRVILVADAYEAMISDRPYRRGRPEADALAELDRFAGAQFDPDCVAALHRVLARESIEAFDSSAPQLAAA
jgi:HD-GYP domain-containing protein (c-di-GMP phosphodiesterase class II)